MRKYKQLLFKKLNEIIYINIIKIIKIFKFLNF